jgi:hypothetical protein
MSHITRVTAIAASLVAFALVAVPAAAAPNTGPVRFWSVSKVEQGAGEVEVEVEVEVEHGAQVGDRLHRVVDLG